MVRTLYYTVMETPEGYIATCENNYKISVFSKDEDKLDKVIHEAAKLWVHKYPDDPHAALGDGKTKLKRRGR